MFIAVSLLFLVHCVHQGKHSGSFPVSISFTNFPQHVLEKFGNTLVGIGFFLQAFAPRIIEAAKIATCSLDFDVVPAVSYGLICPEYTREHVGVGVNIVNSLALPSMSELLLKTTICLLFLTFVHDEAAPGGL